MKEKELERLFQDPNGTPVTEVGQPVGFALDRAQDAAEGAEIVSEGDFEATVSAWTGLDENSQFSSSNLRPKSIIIAIGQSNIDGANTNILDPTIDPRYKGPIEGIKIWTPSSVSSVEGSWKTLDPVNATLTDGYGGLNATRYFINEDSKTRFDTLGDRHYDFLIPLMDKIKEYDNEGDVFLIKNTRSGTFMTSGLGAPNNLFSWTDESAATYGVQGSGLYSTLINDISGAIQQLVIDYPEDNFELRGVIMMQGESESFEYGLTFPPTYPDSSSIAAAWGSNFFDGLYNKFQQDMITMVSGFQGTAASAVRFPGTVEGPEPGIPIPFFLGRIHGEMLGSADYPALHLDLVRQQQEEIAAYAKLPENEGIGIELVDLDTIGEQLGIGDAAWIDNPGKVHFAPLGLDLVADRFFNVYATYYPKINNSLSVFNGAANQVFSSVPGLAYHFTADVNSPIAGPSLKLGTTSGAGDIYTFDLSGENSVSRYFRASTSSTYVTLSNPYEFDPATLFASGEEGAWYDPSDFTTLFEDSFGTIPVTGVGQPVGLMLDKSKGLELGPELVFNGNFDTDTSGWGRQDSNITLSVANGELVITQTGGSTYAHQTISTVPGKTYKVEAYGRLGTNQTVLNLHIRAGGNNDAYLTQLNRSTDGLLSIIFTATTSTSTIRLGGSNSGLPAVAYYQYASVKELPGNHIHQPTSAKRPVLQIENGTPSEFGPELITNGTFDTTSGWTLGPGWTINGGAATLTNSQGSPDRLEVSGGFDGGNVGEVYKITFDVSNLSGTVTIAFSRMTGTTVISSNGSYSIFATTTTAGIGGFSFSTVFGGGVTIDNVSTQKVTSWIGGQYYLQFDGVDDAMYTTTSIDFTATDELTLGYSVRRDTSQGGMIAEFSPNWNSVSVAGVFFHSTGLLHTNLTGPGFAAASRGTAGSNANQFAYTDSSYSPPTKAVIIAKHDLSDDFTQIRYDANDGVPSTGERGEGNFANQSLFLAARNASTLYFDGRYYGFVIINRTLTLDEVRDLEYYLAQKAGVSEVNPSPADPVTYDNISLRQVAGLHAYQNTSTARPLLQQSNGAYYLDFDGVDDRLLIDLPGNLRGTSIMSDVEGTAAYGVNIPSGTFVLGANNAAVTYSFNKNLLGSYTRNIPMSESEISTVFDYFREGGASAVGEDAYQGVADLGDKWRNAEWITDFPLIDSSNATSVYASWFRCFGLSSFPAINTSNVYNFGATWYQCTSLTEFPLIDTSQGINFQNTWGGCLNLTSFPAINTSNATSLLQTWDNCASLSSFPLIDTSQAISLSQTWRDCIALKSFPLINTSNVTNFSLAWFNCRGITEFPLIDTSKGTNFSNTWQGCFGFSSFPQINTSQATNFNNTWATCINLVNFPIIDTSKGTNFFRTWSSCTSLSSFPALDFTLATNLEQTWSNSTALENFPSGVFDNTTGTVNFANTFQNTKLNTQSLDNVLLSINNANTYSGTLNLNSTNMGLPSVPGIAAKYQLENRAWTVNTKAVDSDTAASALFYLDDGAWYDVNDLSTMYQTAPSQSTNCLLIPVTGAGQPVGLLLDKSQGLVLGEELITNGTFDSSSGWSTTNSTMTIASGVLRVEGLNNPDPYAKSDPFDINGGSWYKISITVVEKTLGILYLRLLNASPFSFSNAIGLILNTNSFGPGTYEAIVPVPSSWTQATFAVQIGGNPIPPTTYVIVDNISVKELPGYHAYQNTSTARPTLQGSAGDYYLDSDLVDDRLLVDLPAISGTAVIASEEGTAAYGVNFPAGTHALITNTSAHGYSFARDLVGQFIREGAMNSSEVSAAYDYFTAKNAGPVGENAYSGVSNFTSYWRDANWLTDFPLVDTSLGTNFSLAWLGCTNLTSFPLIDTSLATNLTQTWSNCNNLTSFPLIETGLVTSFNNAWYNCTSLTSFPLIDTSQGITFSQTWQGCTNLRTFEPTDFSSATNLSQAWMLCGSLSSFPVIDCPNVTALALSWSYCYSLSSFPLIDTSQVTNFYRAWYLSNSLSSFPLIDTQSATSLDGAWNNCTSLTTFPAINTSATTNFTQAWFACRSLSSFPVIDTSQGTIFNQTWSTNHALSSFPALDFRSATNLTQTWANSYDLEHFPAGVFDNTSGTTDFSTAFYNTKLNSQSVDNVLISINNANTSGGTITLNVNTSQNDYGMQPPSYWGIAASGELESRGWNVLTITPTAEAQLDSTIAPMFFSGDVGAWYDPSDFDTMFEGYFYGVSIPVTGAGQPVGVILDKSRGLQLGNQLFSEFTDIQSPWVANSDGSYTVVSADASRPYIQGGVTPIADKWYEVIIDATVSAGQLSLYLGRAQPVALTTNPGTYTNYKYLVHRNSGLFRITAESGATATVTKLSYRELPGNHAYQETSTARPVLAVDASGKYFLDGDGVDDFLQATMPEVIGKKIVASPEGIVEYGVNIPAGTHTILRNNAAYTFYAHPDTYGEITSTNPFDTSISSTVIQYFADKGAGPSGVNAFSGTTTLSMRWRQNQWITDFPLIDTSQVASFYYAWEQCLNLSSFPAINTSQATNIQSAWLNCQSLISMPQIDTSKVTTMTGAWNQCYNLTSFPQIETSALLPTGLASAWRLCRSMISFPFIETGHITNFGSCWQDCFVLSSFPLIDTSQGTNFNYTWRSNRALSSFPLIDTGSATSLFNTWNDCTNLSSFPAINTSAVTNFTGAWPYCRSLSSFPLIDTSQGVTFAATWNNCISLTSFPQIDTSQGTDFGYAWSYCNNLKEFPQLNLSAATNLTAAWHSNSNLSSFPQIDCRSATNLNLTWYNCSKLEVFPSGVFDNTSGTTDFSTTFLLTKLNTQSIDNVLLSVNKANTSDGTITLNSTNMQTPGVGGTYAKHQLENRGWTVNTKAVTNDVVVSSVFFEGESAWYDVNDLSTMFVTYLGTSPVTGAGQPVGLMLDKSKGLVLGEELVSGLYSDLSIFTSIVGSVTYDPITSGIKFEEVSGVDAVATIGGIGVPGIPTIANKIYKLSFDILSGTDEIGVNLDRDSNGGDVVPTTSFAGIGTKQIIFKAVTSNINILFINAGGDNGNVTIGNISMREFPGNHALQKSSPARPVLQGSAGDYYLDFDGVDDRLLVDSPGFTGTAYIADELGSAAYGVAIPSGTYSIGTNTTGVNYSFAKDIVGEVLLDRPMLAPELGALQTYFDDLGAGPYGASAYGGETSLYRYWRDANWITEFPLIDTSQVVNFREGWYNCTGLTSFPAINTSAGTSFWASWSKCHSLSSFPLIDTSQGTAFLQGWQECYNLSSFPLIDTSNGTNFQQSWWICSSLTSFPAINTSAGTNFSQTWANCTNLIDFPLIDTSQALAIDRTWAGCYSLTSFPAINTSSAVHMNYAWQNCQSLSSFPLIETSQVTSLYETWGQCDSLSSMPMLNTSNVTTMGRIFYGANNLRTLPQWDTLNVTAMNQAFYACNSLSSFPLLDTRNVTNMSSAWYNCTSLTSFPAINTSAVTGIGMSGAWRTCTSLSSFPWIDTSQVTDFYLTWSECVSLSSFPLIDTSQATTLRSAWYRNRNLRSFPAINTSSVENFQQTWMDCDNLVSFPLIDCRSATDLYQTWRCPNLEHFPAGVFDNTSGTVNFSQTFINTKLTTQSVDNILVSVNNANTASGSLSVTSINNQPPSYWGIVASGQLEDRGWNVTTKTPPASALEDSEIAAMFFSGDEGAWYDPADFSTMFQDSAGTIPVTASGQPVGLILDKSKGLQLGNEDFDYGTFESSAGWSYLGDGTFTVSANTATFNQGSTSDFSRIYAPITLEVGKYYKISYEVVDLLNVANVYVHWNTGGTPASPIGSTGGQSSTIGTRSGIFLATQANLYIIALLPSTDNAYMSIRNISVRELPGNHASQATSTARPILQVDASGNYYLDGDGVDDYLAVTVPQIIGKKIVASPEGTVVYGVNIPSGTHSILRNDATLSYEPYTDIFGEIFSTNPFDTSISSTVIEYLQNKGGGPSGADAYGGITNLSDHWREADWLTEMPLIDTSQATSVGAAWFYCTNLSSFPLLDTANVTAMNNAWQDCRSLVSFPLIDTSKATSFNLTWFNCYSLTSFPAINTSAVTYMDRSWMNCTSLLSFPLIDTSQITNMFALWYQCNSLSSFPLIDTGSVTSFGSTWFGCNNLSSFPLIDTSQAIGLVSTWHGCTNLSSFPLIDTSKAVSLAGCWRSCSKLTEFPTINTSSVTNFSRAWQEGQSLSSFPLIDTSQGTDFSITWYNCNSLSSFPLLDFSKATTLQQAWTYCNNLISFPSINTSAVTNFMYTWQNCNSLSSFPWIDTSQATVLLGTWQNCHNLSSFPLIDTSNARTLERAWISCFNLSSFPLIDTSRSENFTYTWYSNQNLSSFPAINTSSSTSFSHTWYQCTNLTDFPSGVFDDTPCTNFTNAFLNCALTQTSVDNILVSINAAGTSNGTLNMTGGTSSAPSATGLAAKAALESRGWTVTTN